MAEERYGMVIDLERCFGCETCVVGCIVWNGLPEGIAWGRVEVDGSRRRHRPVGNFPNVSMPFVPRLCNHCEDPACVANCPSKAMRKHENGIVAIDRDRCLGCGYCVWNCPYNAPVLDPTTRTMSKCDLCMERVEHGEVPYCVADCPGRARHFGDLGDPDSDVSRLVAQRRGWRLRVESGTSPSVYYLGR
jgi:Fe-S-cluster-containing dehydrogenase component